MVGVDISYVGIVLHLAVAVGIVVVVVVVAVVLLEGCTFEYAPVPVLVLREL